MSAAGGTYRGTPGRGQGRGQIPGFVDSPSNIPVPRPKLESVASSAQQSDPGSTMNASRVKQSKRDEVRFALCIFANWISANEESAGD